jgi:hypothetical protein
MSGLRAMGLLAAVGACLARGDAVAVSQSPFADKYSDSYSNYNDAKAQVVEPLWGSLKPDDFGSREVQFDQSGVRQLEQVPAAGVHPRIFFTPADLPDIRTRLKQTRCGQEAWKNLLCWTEMMKGKYDENADYAKPDRWNGSFGGLHGRVPLFRLGVPRAKHPYDHNPEAAEIYQSLINGSAREFPPFYWNVFSLEAFRCLVENDQASARDLAKAVVTALKIGQAERAAEPKKKNSGNNPPAQPIGAFQLAFTYDFLFNWLTPEQRRAMHDELALSTWSHDNYGTFNEATSSRSNWATFSYWLFEVLGIEGEPGFNDLKVRGIYRGWRNLLTYGWFQSGATFEGEAKNQIGMDGVITLARREKLYGFENLCGHPYLRAYADKFIPESINPMLTGFNKYDLLGGSRAEGAGFNASDMLGLKYMFPDDKIIDWAFHCAVADDYANVPDRPDGYYNALLFYNIFASDFDPSNNDPAKLNLPTTFFCGERALMMTRSSWDKNALMLNMHTRAANGGHPFADRNAIMVAGAGRIWSPNGYASFRTQENSVVDIDDKTQSERTPGRMVDFVDSPLADFAVGDSSYAWDWNWRTLDKGRGIYTIEDIRANRVVIPKGFEPEEHTTNDFSFLKLPFAYLNTPKFESPHWIEPAGALGPVVREVNYPVKKAFRTAGIVRGEHPYALVIDDIQKDDAVHHYNWTLALERDIQIAKVDQRSNGECDVILTGSDPDQKQPASKEALPSEMESGAAIPAGQPMLLVRVLNRSESSATESEAPKIVQLPNLSDAKKYGTIRRLIIPADSVSPDFKVLLYPYRQGDALPTTEWDSGHTSVTVSFGAARDVVAFTPGSLGKTNLAITRDGAPVIDVSRAIGPLSQ